MVLLGVGAALEIVRNDSEIAYQNFIESFRSEETKKMYVRAFNYYITFLQLKGGKDEISLLLKNSIKDIEKSIIDYIVKLKREGNAYSTISTRVAGITYFFSINDIELNKKKIYRYLGEHVKTVEDRGYTREEVKKILEACNLKYKVVVTLMASTGCRIGAISGLKISNLKYIEEQKLHQIFFYVGTKDKYFSFTTPECSKYIFEYLEYRKRCGENITEKSPLIRDDFIQDDLLHAENPKHMSRSNLIFYIRKILIASGMRNPQKMDLRGPKKKMRKNIPANHGFKKFVHTTMTHARILPEIREMLLDHSIGLSDAYYKPTEKEMLDEYLKVVNLLTINDEYRLSKQVIELKEKNQDKDYVIKGKLQEKEEQIKGMQDQISTIMDTLGQILLNQNDNKSKLAKDLIDKGMYISK